MGKCVITNRKKTIHQGKIIATLGMGTKKLYDFVNNNPSVEFHPSEYVNNPYIISLNEKMVALNSALEVDLTGQVTAESLGIHISEWNRWPGRFYAAGIQVTSRKTYHCLTLNSKKRHHFPHRTSPQ